MLQLFFPPHRGAGCIFIVRMYLPLGPPFWDVLFSKVACLQACGAEVKSGDKEELKMAQSSPSSLKKSRHNPPKNEKPHKNSTNFLKNHGRTEKIENHGAVLVQFRCGFGAVSVRFWCSFGAVLSGWCSFGANCTAFWCNLHLPFKAAPKLYQNCTLF